MSGRAPGRLRPIGTAAVTAVVTALALAGCSGDDNAPAPTGTGGGPSAPTAGSGSGSPAPSWDVAPVWEGNVWLRQSAEMPVRMRLYPLQRLDGRVLLTADVTPQGQDGQRMTVIPGPFCFIPGCLTMESVALVDGQRLLRHGPLLQGEEGSPRHDEFSASLDRLNVKEAGVTYRYGAFFADPGTSSVAVDLAQAGALTDVPIVDGGPTAPDLVAAPAAGVSATPTPQPSVSTAADDGSTLITLPVAAPPPDAGENTHELVAPIVGGEVTDYSGTVNLNADVLFAFNSATLSPKAKALIARAVQVIQAKADPARPLLITGHTDNVGGTAYNQRLSTQRAQAVATALKAQAALSGRSMTVTGKGESEPVVSNTTPDGKDDPAGRALNRRVEIAYTPRAEPTTSTTTVTTTTDAGTASPTAGSASGPVPSVTTPDPAASIAVTDIVNRTVVRGRASATVAPVQVVGSLALLRLAIQAQTQILITDDFSYTAASTDVGGIRLTDPATRTSYLAAHDSGDVDRILGTQGAHTMTPGNTYAYYVWTAAPPEGVSTITADLGPLGEVTVPVQR